MRELEILLENRWVLKSENKELYYKIRDLIGEIRKFATDKLGCQVIENSLLVKLEKIPAVPESFMGITEFTSKQEYAFMCILLMFLEDKDAEEQFILSQLTEYIAANMPGEHIDWTSFKCRRRLIKVLRYAAEQGLIKVTDGSDNSFMDEQTGEVLYENTGASRYFMRNFPHYIMEYTSPENFMRSDWFEMDEDRGIARRHRVYKRLLFSVGMYRNTGAAEDFEYLKYYGRRLADDLERTFDCQVHIHKGSAFFMMGDDCHAGTAFPGNNAMSDIMMLCGSSIRDKVSSGAWKPEEDDTVHVDALEFERMLKDVKTNSGSGFTKNYREMPDGEFMHEVTASMVKWTFIAVDEREHQVIIYPSAVKMAGQYPSDFIQGGNSNEQQMAGK